jgi:uncharacterized phage infection (PIP) family protein YhgE
MSNVKGLDSFLDVLAVINDPSKYEAKVLELQNLTKQYTEVVEAVVALAGVNDYTTSIKAREELSKQVLVDAKEEAKGITAKAKETAAKKAAALDERENEVSKREGKVVEMEKTLEAAMTKVTEELQDLSSRQAYALARKGELDEIERELAEKQQRLLAALQ